VFIVAAKLRMPEAQNNPDQESDRLLGRLEATSVPVLISTVTGNTEPQCLEINLSMASAPDLSVSDSFTKAPSDPYALRWVVLLLNCLLLVGNYYAYDNPAALSTLLEAYLGWPKATYDYVFSLLYAVYSFPNIVLPFFSGYFIDRFGPKYVLLFLSICVCLGQAIFAIGVTTRQFWIMILGRITFGIGGESVSVAQVSSGMKNKLLFIFKIRTQLIEIFGMLLTYVHYHS
jgi:hypothetical protein